MKIAIIGGAGNMGQWFVRYFSSLGHSVTISDPRSPEQACLQLGNLAYTAQNNIDAVGDADLVLISVPMETTVEVIKELIPHMREGAILCEIASIKSKIHDTLKQCVGPRIRPLSIHPMFGPGSRAETRKVILLPIVDSETELSLVRALFPDSQIIMATPEQHDRAMALTISLPYLVNTALASVLAEEDISLLQDLGGTTFGLQLLLTSSIMSYAPGLHKSLHTMNGQSISILKKFESKFAHLLGTLIEDSNEFFENYTIIQENLRQWIDLDRKYREMYHLLEAMDNLSVEEAEFS